MRTCARLLNRTHAREMAVDNFMILAIFLLLNVSYSHLLAVEEGYPCRATRVFVVA